MLRRVGDIPFGSDEPRAAIVALRDCKAGRLTQRELAKALGLQICPTQDLLASQGVRVAQGARSETRTSLEELIDSIGGRTSEN